jgi:hypothetical protein
MSSGVTPGMAPPMLRSTPNERPSSAEMFTAPPSDRATDALCVLFAGCRAGAPGAERAAARPPGCSSASYWKQFSLELLPRYSGRHRLVENDFQ